MNMKELHNNLRTNPIPVYLKIFFYFPEAQDSDGLNPPTLRRLRRRVGMPPFRILHKKE